jgi:4-aminobutyrate aminotransferase-like enzyme
VEEFGRQLPRMEVPPPGPRSLEMARRLSRVESRNVTHLTPGFPVFWEAARGANVRDVDGNVYLDLTGAFGVSVAGHTPPGVVEEIRGQAGVLIHGMGDVHPPARKVELLETLARLAPWPDARIVLGSSGSEAVEAALKTALLATGRPGILAFEGAYHGLTLGSLAATHREDFKAPFRSRVYQGARFAPFPESGGAPPSGSGGAPPSGSGVAPPSGSGGAPPSGSGEVTPSGSGGAPPSGPAAAPLPPSRIAPLPGSLGGGEVAASLSLEQVGRLLRNEDGKGEVGAVIIEPIQGRAGVRIPPPGFLGELAEVTRDAGALLIFDEIFTGLGRTGDLFACLHEGVLPDLLCLGKGLGGGLPLSACMGPAAVMDAWPPSTGEAIHTSTFLGNPLVCAAGVALLRELEEGGLVARSKVLGAELLETLERELAGLAGAVSARGRGLFVGLEMRDPVTGAPAAGAAVRSAEAALREGILVLPAGEWGHVLELAPPLVISEGQLRWAVPRLIGVLQKVLTP